jgi:HD-like signal output (HDOD) protein
MSDEDLLETGDAEVTTAQQLLADLSKVRDFPALSRVINKVNHIATSENSRTEELTEAILKDVSLTNKLLRVVNSVHYKQRGAGPVNTVSRAIVILGYDKVRDATLTLMLFDHLANHAQAAELKGEAVESFYCGVLGRSLANRAGSRDSEEVLICSLFRNLGRMMCRLHFFEKSQDVMRLVAGGMSESAASRHVFGLSYDEFGQAIGRHWHLPAPLLQGMAPLPPSAAKTVGADVPRLQVLANLAHDVYRAARDSAPEQTRDAYAELLRRYGGVVHLQTADIEELVYLAGTVMEKEAVTLQVDVRSSPLLARLLSHDPDAEEVQEAAVEDAEAIEGELPQTAAAEAPANGTAQDPTTILISGMQDLTSLLLEDAKPADVLHVAAELLYRARCFDNILICTIAANGRELVGRIGLGPNAERNRNNFRIPLAFTADVFHVAVSKNADLLISDTQADSIRARIPAWYTEKIGARSFLLLPITVNNRTVAVIYADKRDGELKLEPQTLGLVKALRNQITLALRQKSA